MYYLESASMDPAWNLALEQFVFDQLGPREDCFMLWQNDRTIVVGKYQNVLEEINSTYVKEHGITVVRRLSGGGAVYHDRGNLNFTFVARDCQGGMIDFSSFCRPVVDALREMGVPAQINGRNDMTIGDKKFSGNAQYLRQGRVMHHGTLMFDSDLEAVGQALAVRPDKIQSKGLKSVRSRVTNIKPYVNDPQMTVEDFWAALRERMFRCFSMRKYQLSPQELEQVEELRKRIYSQWEWNYGHSPAYSVSRREKFPGGILEFRADVQDGRIRSCTFFGDYMAREEAAPLKKALEGTPYTQHDIAAVLSGFELSDYFGEISLEEALSLMCP